MQLNIGIVGMTHLGLITAISFAAKGFTILGFDKNPALIKELKVKNFHLMEPDFLELYEANKHNVQFSDDPSNIDKMDIIYIAADVVTNEVGLSDLTYVNNLIETIIPYIHQEALLIILSQVPPGFTRKIAFDKNRLFYQVETLIFGQAISRALYPERYIIGCIKPSQPLPDKYKFLLQAFECPILPMRYESAELAKISINCCLVASISVANILSEICENIGADWSEIIAALKMDKRIGKNAYLNPGLGLAGGNLERDLATVKALGHEHGVHTEIVKAWINHSNYKKDWVLRILHAKIFKKIKNPHIPIALKILQL